MARRFYIQSKVLVAQERRIHFGFLGTKEDKTLLQCSCFPTQMQQSCEDGDALKPK